MRRRWLLAAAAAAGLVWWSPVVVAQSGPNCTRGCPCGNACIDCSDTCRIGAGTATNGTSGGSNSDPALVVLLVGGVILGLAALASPFLLPVLCSPKKPPPPSPYKGKEPCRTDAMCPPGHSCVTEDVLAVGVCEPTSREEVPSQTETEEESETFGFPPASSEMTMAR